MDDDVRGDEDVAFDGPDAVSLLRVCPCRSVMTDDDDFLPFAVALDKTESSWEDDAVWFAVTSGLDGGALEAAAALQCGKWLFNLLYVFPQNGHTSVGGWETENGSKWDFQGKHRMTSEDVLEGHNGWI